MAHTLQGSPPENATRAQESILINVEFSIPSGDYFIEFGRKRYKAVVKDDHTCHATHLEDAAE